MKASVERLRWLLAGGAVLLLVVLLGYLGYGRYRAVRTWKDILRRSGAHITHETDGFTYSQSLQGRTVFTVHAAKGVPHGDGQWTLHDAVLTLYGKTPDQFDRIYGSEFEYNEKTGVLRALGETHIDVQAPGALQGAKNTPAGEAKASVAPAGNTAGGDSNDRIIHIRTSGLIYLRKLGVAATDQEVEFRYAGLQCLAKGAEFHSDVSVLHLLSDVRLTGDVRGEPMDVHATKADLDRQADTVALEQPVAHTQGRTMKAAHALLHLRTDGSLERGEADGSVTFDEGTRHLTAPHMDGTFNTASLPQTTKLTGGVVAWDDDAQRPMHGKAAEVDTTFNAQGAPTNMVAVGGAQVALVDHKEGSPALSREMHGDRIVATLVPIPHKTVSRLSEVVATGSAMARGDSPVVQNGHAPETKSTTITADNLRADFGVNAAQKTEVRKLFGTGHTRLRQDAPQGVQQTSSSDTVDVVFAPQPTKTGGMTTGIASAVQDGHVEMHSVPALRAGAAKPDPPSDASGSHAVYDGATTKLTLTGSVHYTQGDTSLTAATLVANQTTGDADAEGNVLATLLNAGSTQPQQATATQATHVTADRAHLTHASQVANFYGSEAQPARLWQGASQVQAASLRFDQQQRTLAARPASPGGLVHAVFANASQASGRSNSPSAKSGSSQVVKVTSATMDYADTAREATFSGGVHMDGTTGQARSQHAVVFLNPAPSGAKAKPGDAKLVSSTGSGQSGLFGGSVQRVVLSGAVRLDQPGRAGTGEQLVYTVADSTYVLTGTPAKPPHMVDVKQGNITGATLLFRSDDSTIIVTGGPPGSTQSPHGRIHTETEVRQ
jgi:lipopolysaccharide export system protein LptA